MVEMLGAACLAAGSYQEGSIVPGEGELGLGTGSGERPHAQVGWHACARPWAGAQTALHAAQLTVPPQGTDS